MRKLKTYELPRLDVEDFKNVEKHPFILVLDNIRSLRNVGAIFRTADAFRVKAVYLCGITARPPHREIRKTAIGATESVEWKYFETTSKALQTLRDQSYTIVGVEQTDNSTPLQEFSPKKAGTYALVFGNEVEGIDEDALPLLDECVEIPQFGTKHSLNVSVSVGVVLWDLVQKIEMAAPNREK